MPAAITAAAHCPAATAQVILFRAPAPAPGFNGRDRMELANWRRPGCRLEVEDCTYGEHGERSSYALLYKGDKPWASWGLTREGGRVLAWNCITHADLGHFASVTEALDAIPGHGRKAPAAVTADIIPLRRAG